MAKMWPITFTEPNLGKRHFHLNSLVDDAYQRKVPFEEIRNLPEESPVDRLFKIDLASKYRNVDYLIQNLKDEDLLYVSRALKSVWLLDPEHQGIITPKWLEDELFPTMITTAVSKMKNWLHLHLKDELRSQKFYEFYKEKQIDYAVKFLGNSSKDFINSEVANIVVELSPKHFKILCEKSPKVAEIYFKIVGVNDEVTSKFLKNEKAYFEAFKVVLKQDPNVYFEISEQIFEKRYSPSQTEYIMKYHKDKFDKKPELYTALLLHMNTLARCLSPEECKEVVLKLARAEYLTYWFSYKNVEPLIKRLQPDERTAFKKKVFVDKDVGDAVEKWPYQVPARPKVKYDNEEKYVFDDEFSLTADETLYEGCFRAMQCKMECSMRCRPMPTYLDRLFDEFRFDGFKETYTELCSRIPLESSYKNREYMMLVLVSKTGGKTEYIDSLIKLLARHKNEPNNFKAAVVRSLVKRAAVWRVPEETWTKLMEFAWGLGLDGNTAEADCHEGLHAVVIRQLLNSSAIDPPIRKAFLDNFSTFNEYSLNDAERKVISKSLCDLLLEEVKVELDLGVRAGHLRLLLKTMKEFKIPVATIALIPAVAQLATLDFKIAESLLRSLYNDKIGRRALFRENFKLIQTDASYLNALRHDITVLDVHKFIELIEKQKIRLDKFLRKLSIYFTEKAGLADVYLDNLKKQISKPEINKSIARPICILQGADLEFITGLDVSRKPIAVFASAIKANMHAGRLKLRLKDTSLPQIGAKAAANKVLICPAVDIDDNVNLLVHWENTVRIAVLLAERNGKEHEAYNTAVHVKPTAMIKPAIRYFRRKGTDMDIRVWKAVKPVIQSIDFSKFYRMRLSSFMSDMKRIPVNIQNDYFVTIFTALKMHKDLPALQNMYSLLLDLDENFVSHVLLLFTEQYATMRKKVKNSAQRKKQERINVIERYIHIFMKYLLFCKSEDIQTQRFEVAGIPFLGCLEMVIKENEADVSDYINKFLTTIRCKEMFDLSYVSPLPILDKIIVWMNDNLPIEQFFKWHIIIHLNKSFHKAVRDSVEEQPLLFEDEKWRNIEGVEVVGRRLGQLIALDVSKMRSEYFDSVIILYQELLNDYFNEQFSYGKSLNDFKVAVLRGILQEETGAIVAFRFYNELKNQYYLDNDTKEELIEQFKLIKNNDLTFFIYGEYYA